MKQIAQGLMIIMYIWTAIIGFMVGGMVGGVLSIMIPISPIYWFIDSWSKAGFSMYHLGWIIAIALLIISFKELKEDYTNE